jgi:hypothetical protein
MPDGLARLLRQPLRRRLLLEYSVGAESPAVLARRLGERVNLVSYHTGVLARHGYVELVRSERHRGVLTRFYRATVGTVIEDAQWTLLPASLRRELVLGTIGQATDEAQRAARDGGFDGAEAHLTRSPLQLDDEGRAAVAACLRRALREFETIAADCRARNGDGRAPFELVMLAFDASSALESVP